MTKYISLTSVLLILFFESVSFAMPLVAPATRLRDQNLNRILKCGLLEKGSDFEVVQRLQLKDGNQWLKIRVNRPGCPEYGYIPEQSTEFSNLDEEEPLPPAPQPINKEIVAEMKNIAGQGPRPSRRVLKKSRGLYRFPVLQHSTFVGSCGSFHYNPDSADLVDSYIHKKLGCGFLSVLQTWNKTECPEIDKGCRISWGDISHKTKKVWSGHKTHTHGQCIDFRPLRAGAFKNEALWWCKWTPNGCSEKNPDYDREKTEKFIRLLRKNGATTVLFNDPVLIRKGIARWKRGHDNHIHFCAKRNSTLNKICKKYQADANACPLLVEGMMR